VVDSVDVSAARDATTFAAYGVELAPIPKPKSKSSAVTSRAFPRSVLFFPGLLVGIPPFPPECGSVCDKPASCVEPPNASPSVFRFLGLGLGRTDRDVDPWELDSAPEEVCGSKGDSDGFEPRRRAPRLATGDRLNVWTGDSMTWISSGSGELTR
jgi:hypothetical protein